MLGTRNERASVLVVEDDASVVSTLRSVLAEDRYGVRVAGSLFQARGLLAKALPDLVILDRGLPDGDGLELCRALRADPRTQRIPILFLSARKEVADRVVGLEEGADDYLDKPFTRVELLEALEGLLRKKGRIEESIESPVKAREEHLRRAFTESLGGSALPDKFALEAPHGAIPDTVIEATVLFSDIRNFTSLSESMSP
ncbi:MAG TPA: hypothetical protein DD417_02355, partial [Elusimicrobia bacterium]|nr:hypothetical protein [Elusimicrobiota bacterium]